MAPWSDVLYFADEKWFRWHQKGIAKPKLGLSADQVHERFAAFAGIKVTIQGTGMLVDDPAVHMLRNADANGRDWSAGVSTDATGLVTGRNSGHQAINLAILAGAKRVVLLGYDGKISGDGRTHFHGGHPDKTHGGLFAKNFRSMVEPLKRIGVEVVNCSPESAIDAFPKASLEQALA